MNKHVKELKLLAEEYIDLQQHLHLQHQINEEMVKQFSEYLQATKIHQNLIAANLPPQQLRGFEHLAEELRIATLDLKLEKQEGLKKIKLSAIHHLNALGVNKYQVETGNGSVLFRIVEAEDIHIDLTKYK